MSHQCLADAFAPIEAANKAAVMYATWGHLAPKKGKTYKIRITYAVGCFGDDPLNPIVLDCDLGDLDSSPWFFDSMTRFLSDLGSEWGGVYEFTGTFRNYKFKGPIRLVYDSRSARDRGEG